MGNKNNIIHNFADPVEERQIRHFACKEMGRQIHRYIYNPQIEIVSSAETKQYFNIFILKNEMV